MSEPGETPELRGAAREQQLAFRTVTTITGVVVGLAFLFGFGNVWALALGLGVSGWMAPLVAPAVDLSVLGLLLAIRYLALYGAPAEVLRPARRLLLLAGLLTLALNITEPLLAGSYGRAAFDAVGRPAAPDRLGRGRPRSAAGDQRHSRRRRRRIVSAAGRLRSRRRATAQFASSRARHSGRRR
jgi:hypothetical protein